MITVLQHEFANLMGKPIERMIQSALAYNGVSTISDLLNFSNENMATLE